jgi:hypothetical protein
MHRFAVLYSALGVAFASRQPQVACNTIGHLLRFLSLRSGKPRTPAFFFRKATYR